MNEHTRHALDAIAWAEREVAASGPFVITSQHWQDVAAVMARPENQDGQDKSWIWRVYAYCRTHFLNARPKP